MIFSLALRADRSLRLAFVGAGGKSTALFKLARQLTSPVVITATTHLAIEQADWGADQHYLVRCTEDLLPILDQPIEKRILITGPLGEKNRTTGLSELCLNILHDWCDQQNIPILIEADGARRLPLKAPGDHEPPIPEWCSEVVYCCGLSGLGKPVSEENVFRAARFAELTHLSMGDVIGLENLYRFLENPLGGLKNIPFSSKKIVLFNQVDYVSQELKTELIESSSRLLNQYDQVLIGSLLDPKYTYEQEILDSQERFAGIVLAAGASERFGSPKQLLDWNGTPFIRVVVETAIQSGLNPVVVVTGASNTRVEEVLSGLPIKIAYNQSWQEGQASSIRVGITKALEDKVGSALFLLCDQPQVDVNTIKKIIEKHRVTRSDIVAATVNGQRANPVLFDANTFKDLLHLEGNQGGRALFTRYPYQTISSDNDLLLLDVDTTTDYQALINHWKRVMHDE